MQAEKQGGGGRGGEHDPAAMLSKLVESAMQSRINVKCGWSSGLIEVLYLPKFEITTHRRLQDLVESTGNVQYL